jgi:hypothetical protein
MCCLRFNADVLLANMAHVIDSHKNQKWRREFPASFLKTYCEHLDTIIGGYKFFEIDNQDIVAAVHRYKNNYTYENGKITIKEAPDVDLFNQQYPDYIASKIKFAADVCVPELQEVCAG